MIADTQTQTTSGTDRIEKKLQINAPISRVWRALASAEEFGTWFKMQLDGEFFEGAVLKGKIMHPGFENACLVDFWIERIQPETYFSYRWHPYAIDAEADYSGEPTTLVEFKLEERDKGTEVTIVESGFDSVPLARRAEAFRMNDKGWNGQLGNLARYVS